MRKDGAVVTHVYRVTKYDPADRVEPPVDGFGLDGLFPSGRAGFHDGAQVRLDIALKLVRVMLRDSGAWRRLETEDTFAVHVGWDQYLCISSSRPCEEALSRTRGLGLFPERLDASPYAFEAEEEERGIQRPDNDGVLRARWRTEPTPGDRDRARRQPED